MKFTALFRVPLSYLPFSDSEPKKNETAPKPLASRASESYSTKIQSKEPVPLRPYRGTSIEFDACACDAVKAIGKKRFLRSSGDTPMLPLPECDASRCNCKYRHHDDRRDDSHDRRLGAVLRTELYEENGNENRRATKRGRRKSDF
jgi:hypothetical protein